MVVALSKKNGQTQGGGAGFSLSARPRGAQASEPRLTAAVPMENPYWSCELTRVLTRVKSTEIGGARANGALKWRKWEERGQRRYAEAGGEIYGGRGDTRGRQTGAVVQRCGGTGKVKLHHPY